MSQFYNPYKKTNLFSPKSLAAFRLSRSKIDLFLNCPRCFYLDRRLGVGQPPGYPFNLNSAVDKLLKKEFDTHRVARSPHPLMQTYQIEAIPFAHPLLDEWRENFKGVTYLDKATNFLVTGAVDDIWENQAGELLVVDYKATSKDGEVSLDADWQIGYKRQMEVYQWLLRKNGFRVSTTGYFVYCNGNTSRQAFDARLEFDIKIIPYVGNDSWIEPTLVQARACLEGKLLPDSSPACDYCLYRQAAREVEIGKPPTQLQAF